MKKRRIKWYKIFDDYSSLIVLVLLIITFTIFYIYAGNIDEAANYTLTVILSLFIFAIIILIFSPALAIVFQVIMTLVTVIYIIVYFFIKFIVWIIKRK
jgi:hypothetical protein